jgi:hypothetical protein
MKRTCPLLLTSSPAHVSDSASSQTPSLPDARPGSDRFRCGGRGSDFLAEKVVQDILA